jgi:spore maturation protein CgeB
MISEKKPLRKLLYVALHYDYGKQHQGPSFEYTNFYPALKGMIPEVIEFDFFTIMQETSRDAMNAKLLETVEIVKPDAVFFVLYTDEFIIETLKQIAQKVPTFNWFCDDHWRFDYFSSRYAPAFSYVSTTDRETLPKYSAIGYNNVIMTQWACNHRDYEKIPGAKKQYEVSFVGQAHGTRKLVMKYLQLKGIKVHAFGRGWKNGRISQEQMIGIFNQSKINLNLSNASWNIHTLFRRKEQIKGRNFEVPGTGSFLLTNYVQGLEHYFDLEKEMVCFHSLNDMVSKIRFYLEHENLREEIALRAYKRTLKEHTYEQRFRAIFEKMGFSL